MLLRARAIENGVWVIAAGGCGRGGPGAIPAWGHSMVVDPWGTVVVDAGMEEGIVRAELDTAAVVAARRQVPALANRRPDAQPAALPRIAGRYPVRPPRGGRAGRGG